MSNLKLNLFENSISFVEEAIAKAISAHSNDHKAWKFAILNVTHAIELSLKEILRRKHPLFVYENIDKPKHTVNHETAINRLKSVIERPLNSSDITKLNEAQLIRNSIIHYEVDYPIEKIRIIFSELVGFLNYLHESYLDNRLIENLPQQLNSFIFDNGIYVKQLEQRAYLKIQDENIASEDITYCPFCFTKTLVIMNSNKGTCYICHNEDFVSQCPGCEELYPESEMSDFSNELEYSNEGSLYTLEDDFGYKTHRGCPNCIDGIKEDISQKRHFARYHEL